MDPVPRGTSSIPAVGNERRAHPRALWVVAASTHCKAHVAAGMCHRTRPKLEVSLGFVPRHIVWPQPGQGVPRALWLLAWFSVAAGELLQSCCEGSKPFPPRESQLSVPAAGVTGAFSHNQPSLGHHQLGIITSTYSRCKGVVPALLTYRPKGLRCFHVHVSPSSTSHRCSVGSAQSRSCRPSPRVPSASPPRHPPPKLGASTPSPAW